MERCRSSLKENSDFAKHILYNRMNKTVCKYCRFIAYKPFNLRRHIENKHGFASDKKKQRLLFDGSYSCRLHTKKIMFTNSSNLQQHLFYFHREDDEETLALHGISKDLI
jgi:ADP-glucose pyrophosphorylase